MHGKEGQGLKNTTEDKTRVEEHKARRGEAARLEEHMANKTRLEERKAWQSKA